MLDQSVQSVQGVQRQAGGVIPRRQLIIIGAAMLTLVAVMVYMSFKSLSQGNGSPAASSAISPRLASTPDQGNSGGDVTVRLTWTGPEAGPMFNVVMDSHSVNLDPYDLGKMVVLRTNDGRESAPLSWDAPAGGHHRKGQLVFSELALDGKPLVAADTESIELVIYDLSDVPTRSFKWQLR
jgi:hypothetical protein